VPLGRRPSRRAGVRGSASVGRSCWRRRSARDEPPLREEIDVFADSSYPVRAPTVAVVEVDLDTATHAWCGTWRVDDCGTA